MIAHLISSTVILALALAATHLPWTSARTRYALVFAALLKFAIPPLAVPLPHAMRQSIAITALGPLTAPPSTPVPPARSAAPLAIGWAVVAAALALRTAVRMRRALSLQTSAASAEELATLETAARRIGLRRRVALRRSDALLAPASIGIVRLVIVIPEGIALRPEELEAILAHECAHVARRDNALSVVESLLGCALWFHPLVWYAWRALDRAREAACDERVTASGDRRTYADALMRVARNSVALPAAGISCAAGTAINERIEAIMNERPHRLLPHRLALAGVIAVVALTTFAGTAPPDKRYDMAFSITRSGGQFLFDITVTDHATGVVVSHPRITAEAETRATATTDPQSSGQQWQVSVIAHTNGQAEVTLNVLHDGDVVETMTERTTSADNTSRISLQLKDADLRDVINTLGKLANLKVRIDDEVHGTVTINMKDVPWTQLLDQMLHDAGYHYDLHAHDLYVHR